MRALTVGNMYPPHHFGGYELTWQASVRAMREAGHEVSVLTTDFVRPGAGRDDDPDVARDLRWYWRDHGWPRLGYLERLRLERQNLRTLRTKLGDQRPDLVVWWAMGGMSMSLIQEVANRGVPAVAIVLDDWLIYGPAEDQWQRAMARSRAAGPLGRVFGVPSALRFDGVVSWVFISQTVLKRAREAGWRAPGARVVPVGVDDALFEPVPSKPWTRSLLYVGRLDPRKGIETAIRATARLDGATLVIDGGGDEDYRRTLVALGAELGLKDRLVFQRSRRADLPSVYARADAVLFPVLWEEPFGLVPLEAMAVGRPVIATGTGGSGEYLRDRSNCLLFDPPQSAERLAGEIIELERNSSLREALREAGMRTAAHYTQERFLTRTTEIMRSAASGAT